MRRPAATAVDTAFASGSELANYGRGVDSGDLAGRGENANDDGVLEALGVVGDPPSFVASRYNISDARGLAWRPDDPLTWQPHLGREGASCQLLPGFGEGRDDGAVRVGGRPKVDVDVGDTCGQARGSQEEVNDAASSRGGAGGVAPARPALDGAASREDP